MKKISTVLSAMLVATSFVFAITDAQKTAFANKINNDFLPVVKAYDALGDSRAPWGEFLPQAMAQVNIESATKPVAEWAIKSPAEYKAWLDENKLGSYGYPVVRQYISDKGLLNWETCALEHSAAIFDHRKQYDDAMKNESMYRTLKSGGFVSGGFKFSDGKIRDLAKKFGDLDVFEATYARNTPAETKAALAQDFANYFDALTTWAGNENLDAMVRWKKFEGIEIGFMKYKVAKNSDGTNKYPKLVDAWKDVQDAHQTYRTFYEWNK